MERGLAIMVAKGAIIDHHARIVRQHSVQVFLKAGAVDEVWLDRQDALEFALCVPGKCFDHEALMGTSVEQNFVVVQRGDNFRDEKPLACRHRCLCESPFLAQTAPCEKLQMVSARYVIVSPGQNPCNVVPIMLRQWSCEPYVR